MRLVADIGGTNARLALCKDSKIVPQTVRNFSNDDWPHLYDIVTAYLKEHAPVPPDGNIVFNRFVIDVALLNLPFALRVK